jgi:hypothetical protein
MVFGHRIAEGIEQRGGEAAGASTDIEKSFAGTRAMRSTQSTAGPSPAPSDSEPSGPRTTATTSRYSPGAARLFSSSSRNAKRRRSSTAVKSRNGRRTAFFSFQTVSAPTYANEICVSVEA